MFKIILYLLNIFLAGIAMPMMDDDPTRVSALEWALYAVILFSAWSLIKLLLDLQKNSS
ncbi:MAG: hypothetical protein K0U68_11730 [Gammaproteobacteria bacterium]|nr:hypothetical protein [Gammaproteobacteria bacterium]